MVKCSFVLLIFGFGLNILLITWNMVYRNPYFNHRKFIEKAPNNNDLLKHLIDENLLEEATNSSELLKRLGGVVLNKSADMNMSHHTGKVSKHAMRIYSYVLFYANCIIKLLENKI